MIRADLFPELAHVVPEAHRYVEARDLAAQLVVLNARAAGTRIRDRARLDRDRGPSRPKVA